LQKLKVMISSLSQATVAISASFKLDPRQSRTHPKLVLASSY
jgi:hypothetical protein